MQPSQLALQVPMRGEAKNGRWALSSTHFDRTALHSICENRLVALVHAVDSP